MQNFGRLRTSYAVDMTKATHLDPEQTGYEWIAFSELRNANIYPKVLKTAFDGDGNVVTAVYLGDIN